MVRLYIGNLAASITEDQLRALFAEHGRVSSVQIDEERETGAAERFGYVEVADDYQAEQAVEALNGREISGHRIVVSAAHPNGDR